MKKIFIMLLLLLGITQAVAQEYEYVPFVREGVKWVYQYAGERKLELKGDTVINDKTYKAMHSYHGDSINSENDTIAVFLREADKVVYGIVPDGRPYDLSPIICLGSSIVDELLYSGKEFILYDFNDPFQYYSDIKNPYVWEDVSYHFKDTIEINGKGVGRHSLSHLTDFCIIEGIGYDGIDNFGYTLAYQYGILVGDGKGYPAYTATPRLYCVIEDGDTIYKAMKFRGSRNVLPFVNEGVKWVNERVTVNHGDTTCCYYSYKIYGKDEGSSWPFWSSYACHYTVENAFNEMGDSIIAHCWDQRIASLHSLLCYYNHAADRIVDNGLNLIDYSYTDPNPYHDPYDYGVDVLQLYTFDGFDICPFNTVNYYIDKQIEPFLNRHNFVKADPVNIEGKPYLRYAYIGEDGDTLAYVVEGIGFDSRDMGDLLTPFTRRPDPTADYQEWCGLCHVVKDGKIIYKGMRYTPDNMTGVDEVVADKVSRPVDPRYYDLMGRSLGTELPTTPGIYIHQGKKIVVR